MNNTIPNNFGSHFSWWISYMFLTYNIVTYSQKRNFFNDTDGWNEKFVHLHWNGDSSQMSVLDSLKYIFWLLSSFSHKSYRVSPSKVKISDFLTPNHQKSNFNSYFYGNINESDIQNSKMMVFLLSLQILWFGYFLFMIYHVPENAWSIPKSCLKIYKNHVFQDSETFFTKRMVKVKKVPLEHHNGYLFFFAFFAFYLTVSKLFFD